MSKLLYHAPTSVALGTLDRRDSNIAQELAPVIITEKDIDRRQRQDSGADRTNTGTIDMSSSISPTVLSALRHAQRRLLDARAKSSDGRLTVANLAREAGVSRHSLPSGCDSRRVSLDGQSTPR
jgi:hypothetical protein